jgi:redox-sensitive bicupin YhaK (pirin superfamily)
MITLRRSQDRGYADHGWLESYHSFSFADYHDPAHMGVGNLRVINEDRIAPGTGFGTHGHRDMEIVSYVLEGELAHKDSMGNGEPGAANAGVIRPGDVQRMSAGTGVRHSEFNHATDRATHFLQIWILPDRRGIDPGYEQRPLPPADPHTGLLLVASSDGRHDSVTLHQDASVYVAQLAPGAGASYDLATVRRAWVQVARGGVELNGHTLSAGDGARFEGESSVRLRTGTGAEVLLFDLP